MCVGFGVAPVHGAAVRSVFSEDRCTLFSRKKIVGRTGEEIRCFTCSKYSMRDTVFPYRLLYGLGIFFWTH